MITGTGSRSDPTSSTSPDRPLGPRSPRVSVVTPFFNTADYLPECIESVLAQTWDDWEYILADNCSTDGSAGIAESYAQRDPRIRLVRETEFLDQLRNYNRALGHVSTESRYCKIVQADDWIFPNCLEEMVRVAETAPNVSVIGSYSLYGSSLGHAGLPYQWRVIPGLEMLRVYLMRDLSLFGSQTCVMYRTADVKARREFYDPTSPVADVEACFELLQQGDFAFVHQILTYNRRQENSLWARVKQHNATLLHKVILTTRYGPMLFPPGEVERLGRRVLSEYYAALGEAALERRSSDFWKYQNDCLAHVGQKISKVRLARGLLWAVGDALGNPKRTLGRALRRSKASAQWPELPPGPT